MSTKSKSSRAKKNKGEYYIAPKDLNAEFRKYYDSNPTDPSKRIISEKLGQMIINIAKHLATKSCYNRYSYKDEFIGDAILKVMQNIWRINLSLPNCNPFSYITCICNCAFTNRIKKTEERNKKLKELQEQIYEDFCTKEGIANPRLDRMMDPEGNIDFDEMESELSRLENSEENSEE